MSNWKCGRCGVVYSFDEWMTLEKVPAVTDDPDPKKNYGYSMVCKHCGYVFHKDKPIWKAHGEIKHHITSLHWLVNKLTRGSAPHHVGIELSTVFLELAHDAWRAEPNWYETMFFCYREDNKVECWIQERYHTEEQAIEGHRRWLKLLRDGKYIIRYALDRIDYENPDSKYRFEWRIDFNERHRRMLHGAKVNREMEGTTQALGRG